MDQVGSALRLYTAAIMFVFLLVCVNEWKKHDKRTMLFIAILILDIMILLTENQLFYLSAVTRPNDSSLKVRITMCIIQVSYYGLLAAFCEYSVLLVEDTIGKSIRKNWLLHPICAIFAILWCLSSWNGMFIRIESGGLVRGPLYLLGQLGGWGVGVYIVFTILRYREPLGTRTVLVLLTFPVFPLAASFVRLRFPVFSSISLSLSFSLLMVYNFNFWQQRRRLERQEIQMAEDQMAVMISEIGPHFIYNVLNSIYYLCRKDPEKAQLAVAEFSEYLRGNLSGVEEKNLISGEKELSHVRHYLNLEQMRYGEDLRVEMDLETTSFMIPPLTIQPLVENAVKHGVMQREEGGTIRVITRRIRNGTEVRVEDDGVGFDPKRACDDGEVHIGVKSVQKRLWGMCHAKMRIESQIGVGTVVTISIPDHAADRG